MSDTEQPEINENAEGAELNLDELETARDDITEKPDLTGDGTGTSEDSGLEAVYDIPVTVSAVLGTTKMQIHQLLKLGRGAVVELDRKVGEAVDIYVNDRLVARGEVVIVEDKLGITMTEIVKSGN